MALYGLCVFLETPQHLRRGRKKYITTSLLVTFLVTLMASLDMAYYFQGLFQSTSPSHWRELLQLSEFDWKTKLCSTGLYIVVWMGDVLLVSALHSNGHAFSSWNVFYRCIVAM
jgi:hypothetical protein